MSSIQLKIKVFIPNNNVTDLSKSEESFLADWPHPTLGEELSMFGSGGKTPD
jgi:hypothetical protein